MVKVKKRAVAVTRAEKGRSAGAVFAGGTNSTRRTRALVTGQGSRVLGMIATQHPTRTPADVLKETLTRFGGNLSVAAREFDVSRISLMVAINAVGLGAWLEETWPARARGGRPGLAASVEIDPRVKGWVEKGGVLPRTGEYAMAIVRARVLVDPPESFASIAARLGGSKQNAQAIFRRAVWSIEEILMEQDAENASNSAS